MAILVQIWQTATIRTYRSLEEWVSYEVRDENNYNKLSPVRTRRLSSKIATTLQLSTLIVIGEEMLACYSYLQLCKLFAIRNNTKKPQQLKQPSPANKIDCFVIPVQMILLISKSISFNIWLNFKCSCFILFLGYFWTFCNYVDHNNNTEPFHASQLFNHYFSQNKPKYFPHILSRILFPVPGPPPATHSDPDLRIVRTSWCQLGCQGPDWGPGAGLRSHLKTKRISLEEWSQVAGGASWEKLILRITCGL